MTRIGNAKKLKEKSILKVEKLFGAEVSKIFSIGKERGWVEKPLGEYIVNARYGTSEKCRSDDTSGIPILRMGNIQKGRLDPRDLKYLHLDNAERVKLLLKKRDILVNRTNSAELVGKCAVFDLDGEYGFASYLIRLRFDTTRANPQL